MTQTGTFEAILAAHRDEYDSDCGMYFGCSCGWDNDDIGSNEGYVEHVAGLLATAAAAGVPVEGGQGDE